MGRLLANYVIKYHFPHLANLPEPDEEGVAKGAVNPPEAEGQDPKIDVTKNKFTGKGGGHPCQGGVVFGEACLVCVGIEIVEWIASIT